MALAVIPCHSMSTARDSRSLHCPAKPHVQCRARQVVADLLMCASDIRLHHIKYTLKSIAAFVLLWFVLIKDRNVC